MDPALGLAGQRAWPGQQFRPGAGVGGWLWALRRGSRSPAAYHTQSVGVDPEALSGGAASLCREGGRLEDADFRPPALSNCAHQHTRDIHPA